MKFKFNKLLSLGVSGAILASSLCACGSGSDYTPLSDDDSTVYTIGICQSSSNDYNNTIKEGFQAALEDLFGEKHIQVTDQTVSDSSSADSIISGYVANNTQLIFTDGEQALNSAATGTTTIPVVATGIINFQNALHITDSSWNGKTGTNITGVSSRPPVAAQLSLLIEATSNIKAVGILYSPDDTDAVYQDELLEAYLDQAGIPWKEYEIATSEAAKSTSQLNSQQQSAGTTILPSTKSAASAKEGTDNTPDSIGETNVVNGIISSESARVPMQSANWYGGKNAVAPAASAAPDASTAVTDTSGTSTDSDATITDVPVVVSDPSIPTMENGASAAQIASYAASECSAVYMSSQNLLADQSDVICSACDAAGVSTIAGDTTIGKNALATLYIDPFEIGYQAGKQAYRILVNKKKPGDIAIDSIDQDKSIKLYQDSISTPFGMTFPKSFTEIDTFLSTYIPGQNTTRITADEAATTSAGGD